MENVFESLGTTEGMEKFTLGILESIRQAAVETQSFCPCAFVIATRDPETEEEFSEPKAVPLSADIIMEALPEETQKAVMETYDSPSALLEAVVKISAERGRAVGVLMISAGVASEIPCDTNGKPTGEEKQKKAVLAVMQHQKLALPRVWMADFARDDETFAVTSMGAFEELETVPEMGTSANLLPLWN